MESESEVPPPSLYANSQSKERTILLKKMAQKQKNKEASKKKEKSVPITPHFDEKSIDALKKEIGATCDCVADIAVTIESMGERIKKRILEHWKTNSIQSLLSSKKPLTNKHKLS
jgi:hypothetical protein